MNKLLIIISVFLFLSCNNKDKNIAIQDKSIKQNINKTDSVSKTFNVDFNKVLKTTPGNNGIPTSRIIKLSAPDTQTYTVAPIIPGVSYLPQSIEEKAEGKPRIKSEKPVLKKLSSPKIKTLATKQNIINNKDTIFPPRKIKLYIQNLNDTVNYTIQNKDTILKIKQVITAEPIQREALLPRFKDESNFNIKYLDVDQGLPSSYIISATQAHNGIIWLGTAGGGLVAYDGHSFIQYTKKQGLINNIVLSILEDSKHNIWVGTVRGLSLFDGKKFTNFKKENSGIDGVVNTIFEDKDSNIWIGTDGGGLVKYDGEYFSFYTKKQGLPNNYVRAIYQDSKGNIWIGTNGGGLSKISNNKIYTYTTKQGLPDNSILTITEDNKHNIWFGTSKGLCKLKNDKLKIYTTKNGLSNNNILSLKYTKNNTLWVGTVGKGLSKIKFKHKREEITRISEKEGLSNNTVLSVIEDDKGNILAGTNGGGLSILNPNSFTYFTKADGLPNDIVNAICEDNKGNIWIGTNGGGICKFDGKKFIIFTKKQKLPDNQITSIAIDNKNNLWFGTRNNGVFKLLNDNKIEIYDKTNGLPDNSINSIAVDKTNKIWIASESGVSVFDGKLFTTYTKKCGFIEKIVSVNVDKQNNIWLGTWGKGAIKFDGNKFSIYTKKTGLNNNTVWASENDKYNNIWLLTNGGANIINNNKILTISQKNGLSNNHTWGLIIDKKSNYWVSSEKGLDLVITENPMQIKDSDTAMHIIHFGKQDGLKGLYFIKKSAFLDSENRAWWGTGKALLMLNLNEYVIPEKSKQNAPKTYLTSILIKEKSLNFRTLKDSLNNTEFKNIKYQDVEPFFNYPQNLELPFNLNHLTFNFSAIDWLAPHKIQYSFKLEGLDNSWSKPSIENKAVYRNIPYGDYTFKVRAIGEAGVWSNVFEYSFSVNPPWWQTWWARMLYVLVGLSAVYLLIRWRTAKLKERQKELERIVKERTAKLSEANEELNQRAEELKQLNNNLNLQNEEIKSQRDEIQKQKQIVEEIHSQLSQSIDYATRLQQSILPEDDILKKYLTDYFILFRPKDKVSGDFYWWTHIENHTIITVADCTGHGVPGAFMSMLGASFLREIIEKEYITHTGVILRKLRKEIIKALKQKGEDGEQKDGMDMSIISINHETNTVQYSGAYNPIYIIKDEKLNLNDDKIKLYDNSELKVQSSKLFYEIKPDKMPIAIYERMHNFTTHEFELKKGDCIYLFSDGYADQFGGPKGRKFKYKPFKRLLLANADKSMTEQKEILEHSIIEWQGSLQQIDDITVLGIKL